MDNKYIVSPSPHIQSKESTKKIMWSVAFALLPAGIAGVWIFGASSIYVILASVLAAVLTEIILQRLTKQPISISDGSAIVTGLLLAYNLPAAVPIWLPVAGSFFAIAIAKHTFGGLGKNIFNPALAGRAFLMVSWPAYMTRWVNPRFWPDTISAATPLTKIAHSPQDIIHHFSYWDLLIGNRGGCIGEVCILAILTGAAFLLCKGYIRWHTPVTYIFTVGLLTWIFGGRGSFRGDWIFAILGGGLMLGAFFMATDMVTTPLTSKGQLIFGLGCGILTFVIRKWAGYPEGVSYSILMMNAAAPIIDRFTPPLRAGAGFAKPRLFGKKKGKRQDV